MPWKEKSKKRVQMMKWRAKNKKKISEYNKTYHQNKRKVVDELKASRLLVSHRRRVRLRGNRIERIKHGFLKSLTSHQKNKCAYCKTSLDYGKHLDHIFPVALGGSHSAGNFQYLCPTCNSTKSAKHPIEYAKSIGLLL